MFRTAANEIAFSCGNAIRLVISGAGLSNVRDVYPAGNAAYDLGHSAIWWDYAYIKHMDHSAIPTFAGTGAYLTLETDDDVSRYSSSERLKKNISTVQPSDALLRINALRPVEFSPNKDGNSLAIDSLWEFRRHRGFIAEEVSEVSHEYAIYDWWASNDPASEDYDKTRPALSALLVDGTRKRSWTDDEVNDYYSIDEAAPMAPDNFAILADAVAAIQELSTKLEAAESRIAVLEAS